MISFLFWIFLPLGLSAKTGFEFQRQPGFVGYIPAGLEFVVQNVSHEQRRLVVTVPSDPSVGRLEVTFKNFERALGRKRKVEHLDRQEPLRGQHFILENNLLLHAIKN